jgi:hypothetical protein
MPAPWEPFLAKLRAGKPQPGQSGVEVEEDNTKAFTDGLTALTEYAVYVGIPSDDDQPHQGMGPIGPTARSEPASGATGGTSRINNAMLGYLHETGSPSQNIPARPFLYPGVKESRDQWLRHLNAAAEAAMAGKRAEMLQSLARAGLVAQRAVRMRIRAGIPPPLSPRTVARRRRRTPGSSYRRKAMTAADVTPLIDTAAMLRSISCVLKKERS